MKKKLLILIILLIETSISFAQYNLNIKWNAEDVNCTCGVGIDSTFKINIYIRDVANSNDFQQINTTASGSQDSKIVPVLFIEDYCELYHDYTPVFYIQVTVVLHCDDNPPFDACDGFINHGPESCNSFSQGDINVDVGNLD